MIVQLPLEYNAIQHDFLRIKNRQKSMHFVNDVQLNAIIKASLFFVSSD